jgi:FkbM family methyltransferase
MSNLGEFRRMLYKRKFPKDIVQIIAALGPDDICIDVGANVGLVSEMFLSKGCKVYAFEPNPSAFVELLKLREKHPNLLAYDQAVAKSAGTVELYLHNNHEFDPVKYSTGSSLIASKPNVSRKSIKCVGIDFSQFLMSIEKVTILKIDIEGYEVELVPELIRQNALDNVRYVFVETHERKWSNLEKETQQMKELVGTSSYQDKIRWDWP